MEFSYDEIELLKSFGFNFSKILNNLISNSVLEKTIDANHYELITKKEDGSFVYEMFGLYDDGDGLFEETLCNKDYFNFIDDLVKYLL